MRDSDPGPNPSIPMRSQSQGDDLPGLSTTDMDITEVMSTFNETPVPEDDNPKPSQEELEVPVYIPKNSRQKGRLVKSEDRESRDRYPGATYEVRQFALWNEQDMKDYQSLMSEVGTDKYSRVVFQDRVYIESKQSWKILVEVQHFVLVAR